MSTLKERLGPLEEEEVEESPPLTEDEQEAVDLKSLFPIRSIFESLETDDSLEKQGVEFYFGLGIGYWKLAWSGDITIQAAIADAMKPYSQLTDKDLRNPAIDAAIREALIDVYAEHVVKGWREVVGDDGDEVEYSKESSATFMKNPRISRNLFKMIREYSGNFANYRKVYAEDVAGKL